MNGTRHKPFAVSLVVVLTCGFLAIPGGTDTFSGVALAGDSVDRVGSLVTREGTPVVIPAGATDVAYASCRRGEQLVGGGALGTHISGDVGNVLTMSAPDPNDARQWRAQAANRSGTDENFLTSYAICAQKTSRANDKVGKIVKRVSKTISVPAGEHGEVIRQCRSGERLIGGGAYGTDGNVLTISSPLPNAQTRVWMAGAQNTDPNVAGELTAYAYCAKNTTPERDRVGKVVGRIGATVSVPPGDGNYAFSKCRRGERLIDGGGLGDDNSVLTILAPDPGKVKRWTVRAFNTSGSVTGDLTAYAYCAKPA